MAEEGERGQGHTAPAMMASEVISTSAGPILDRKRA